MFDGDERMKNVFVLGAIINELEQIHRSVVKSCLRRWNSSLKIALVLKLRVVLDVSP